MMRIGWRASLRGIRRGVACFPLVLYICCPTKGQHSSSVRLYNCVRVCLYEGVCASVHLYDWVHVLYKTKTRYYLLHFLIATTTIICIIFLLVYFVVNRHFGVLCYQLKPNHLLFSMIIIIIVFCKENLFKVY